MSVSMIDGHIGPDKIRMTDKEIIKPCPFCGGKSETHFQPLYTENGVCIRCTKCGARSRFLVFDCVYEQYHKETKVYITEDRAIKDAIDLWNRRATDGE